MANLEDRGPGDRLRWRVRWRDPDGRHRSRSFARKTDAQRYLHELATELNAGTYLDPDRGRMTVGEIAAHYLERIDATRKPSTAAAYREVYASLVAPRWARTPVSAVTYMETAGWVASLSSRLSASRTRHAYRILRVLLDDAVRDRRIPSNPALGITLPRIPRRREHAYLTHGQVAALADAAGRLEDRALILTLAYVGLRWGEAVALRWDDVDLLRGRISVRRSITDIGGRLVEGTPKTHATRVVPIPDPVRRSLSELRPSSGLVFPSPGGAVLRGSTWRARVLDPATRSAGLPEISPHALRHTAASLAVASGASVKAVQRMLGHASAAMTLDVYADLFDDDLDALSRSLSRAAEDAPPWIPPPDLAHRETPSDPVTGGRRLRGRD